MFGLCFGTQTKAIERAAELFQQGDTDKNGLLSCSEIRDLMKKAVTDYPQVTLFTDFPKVCGSIPGVGVTKSVCDFLW